MPEDALLVSFDVVSLYSNIPHDLGRTAVENWLARHPELIHNRYSKEFILEGLKLYRQIVGIPMGTNCAPLVADLFLYCYERDFMDSLNHDN